MKYCPHASVTRNPIDSRPTTLALLLAGPPHPAYPIASCHIRSCPRLLLFRQRSALSPSPTLIDRPFANAGDGLRRRTPPPTTGIGFSGLAFFWLDWCTYEIV